MRRESTGPDRALWPLLRNGRLSGLKFRRQLPTGRYVVDFYCHEARLIVEVDGNSHIDRTSEDLRREAELREMGYRILRVSNDEVLQDPDAVCMAILKAAGIEPL